MNFFPPQKGRVSISFPGGGRVTFFNKKYKGRARRFYIHAHRDSSGSPPPPILKNECSLIIMKAVYGRTAKASPKISLGILKNVFQYL